MLFDGSNGNYVSGPSTNLQLGSDDFTIEAWVNMSAFTNPWNAVTGIWSNGGSSHGYSYQLIVGQPGAIFQMSFGGIGSDQILATNVGSALSLNTWYHLAVVRSANLVTLYVNGVAGPATSISGALNNSPNPLFVGYSGDGNSAQNGYLDELRITKGVARYTGNFIPPATAYYTPGTAIVDSTAAPVVSQYAYDGSGRMLTATDSLNRVTSYSYYPSTALSGVVPTQSGHTLGDLASITNPAGMVTTFDLYDPVGHILQTTDPKGVVTVMTYTPRGWVSTSSTTAPGGVARTTSYSYDGVGQLIGVSNPDGTTLSFSYDAAHRLVGATDARGNTVAYTLDNVGNHIAEQIKDPSGNLQRSIARSFDALNRLQQVTGAPQ